MIAIRFDSK